VVSPDVIVVGGGIIGLSIAWRAASAGLAVILIEERSGRGASWAAAGMLAPVSEAHYGEERLLELNLESSRRWPQFVAELEEQTGMSAGYQACGTVIVAPDADDFEAMGVLLDYHERLGLKVERLTARELRRLEPALAPAIRGGALVAGDHNVDNRLLAAALLEACRRTGVRVKGARVRRVRIDGDRVRGVALDDGENVDGEVVVLAAGCWSGGIEGIPDEAALPVRPVKGQLLYVRGPSEPRIFEHNIRSMDVYLVPRGDGRVVVGATVEEMGFDLTVTVEAMYTLMRDAFRVAPGIGEMELVECVAGLRPGSPDNAPLLGDTGINGLIAATGHYRNGILLAPATADAIGALLVTGRTPEIIVGFSPQRFARVPGRAS
jgi:glycine oxidase